MTEARTSRLLSTSLTTTGSAGPVVLDGKGSRLKLADGRWVLDASNTSAPLGHQHPEIVAAIADSQKAPVVNEGWGWWEREEAALDLIGTALADEDWVGAVRFFISASEANDAAMSLAQAITGRRALVARDRAYHGLTGLSREVTTQPQWHGGLSSPSAGVRSVPHLADVRSLPAPGGHSGEGVDPLQDQRTMTRAREAFRDAATVIIDYSQGGIYHCGSYQDNVAALAREAGALWIADETVTGFGRVGGWFQFQHGTARPDMITMGKSLAAGAAPAGALVISQPLLDEIGDSSWQNYSTFRGHPTAMAAIRAHLRASAEGSIGQRALQLEPMMKDGLARLAGRHPGIARFDGRGLHWTVEFHGPDWRQWRGLESNPLATRVVDKVLTTGVLVATSAEQTSLFLAPPLTAEADDLEELLSGLDVGLEVADEAYEKGNAL